MANKYQFEGKDINIKLIGDATLLNVLRELDYKTQQSVLKRILKDSANRTIVPAVQREVPIRTGKLRGSIGTVMGKSKRTATVFAGPRMSHSKFTKDGRKDDKYSGWVANIFEYAKSEWRYPEKSERLRSFQYPPRYHKRVRGLVHKKTNIRWATLSQLKPAEKHTVTSIRTILTRTWNSAVRKINKM